MTATGFDEIDWAEVATRAKADFGDECIDRFSGRMRITALKLQASVLATNSEDKFAPAARDLT